MKYKKIQKDVASKVNKIVQWQKIIFLEAVVVEGHAALLAHQEGLDVLLPLDAALLTVPPGGAAFAIHVGGHHPVVHAVVPGALAHAAADAPLH